MKICVIVPSDDQLNSAGVRIRYIRLVSGLKKVGSTLTITPIDEFNDKKKLDQDVYIFCKCYDVRAILLARILQNANITIGADFFDDYFSQTADARFTHLRGWLRAAAPLLDFAMCATPAMYGLLTATLLPGKPCHILNDPVETPSSEGIAQKLQDNLERTIALKRIDVAWFGMGDNPYFPVGLEDLHAYKDELAPFRKSGFDLRFSILTNKRAMTTDKLALLNQLGFDYSVDEWNEEKEQTAIGKSLFCFLPVNAQPFSRVKSLNRAMSVLAQGSQVLSCGYPLYSVLSQFIYRDAGMLISDLKAETLLVNPSTLTALNERIQELGGQSNEIQLLSGFLSKLTQAKGNYKTSASVRKTSDCGTLGVIHANKSQGALHRFAQRLGYLSVASPFAAPSLNYDIKLEIDDDSGNVNLCFSLRAAEGLDTSVKSKLQDGRGRNGKQIKYVPLAEIVTAEHFELLKSPVSSNKIERYSLYDSLMQVYEYILLSIYPRQQLLLSENEAPYQTKAFMPRVAHSGLTP